MVKLIAFDLDGTLLNHDSIIPEENIEAISYAKNKGVAITICSGRPYSSVKIFADQIGATAPLVVGNGSESRTLDGKIIYNNTIPYDICDGIVKMAIDLNLHINVYAGEEIFTNSRNKVIEYYDGANMNLPEDMHCKYNFTEGIMRDITKRDINVLKIEVLNITDSVRPTLKNALDEIKGISTVGSWVYSVEILTATASKGEALKHVVEYMNLNIDETMAFGDYNNDISMFKVVGKPIAMGNADDNTKSYAAYVTDTNNNCGVAKAIYKFV